jgi:hypothetical protein
MRLRRNYKSAWDRWIAEHGKTAHFFIVGRDKGKLGWFWRHSFNVARCGPYCGAVVNPDSGLPVVIDEDHRLLQSDFERKGRFSETLNSAAIRSTARCGRPTELKSGAAHRSNSSVASSPRHSAPPRYVSEKLVRDAVDSALTGTSDGRSLRRPPPSSSPGTEPSVSNSSIRVALPERTPLRAATLLFESEPGPDENRLSQAVRSESSNTRNSRSDRSATGMIDVDYAMRP